jgi:pimeloyl-ACP methyl ester carboxylesterase
MKNLVTIADGRIEYSFYEVKRPAAPTIVMLHEGLGALSLWRDLPRKLSNLVNCSVFVYSRHGYGQSDFINSKFNVKYMHKEALNILPKILNHFDISNPILYGHSDGASIALIHASSADTGIMGLILEAPHVFVEEISLNGLKDAKKAFEQGGLKAGLAKHHREPEMIFRCWNNIWLSPEFLTWNIVSCLSNIQCPALLIQGETDAYGTLSQLDTIEKNVSGICKKKILPNTGHSPHRENPKLVLRSIQQFISKNINAQKTE